MGPTQHRLSAWDRLAGLTVSIEGYGTRRHELDVSSGFRRVTTEVVLRGGGDEGRGEDVTYTAEEHDGFPTGLALAGDWSLEAFSRLLGGLELFPSGAPAMAAARRYRRWAFESAALDLALRQRGQSLGVALGRSYRPLRFVVSTRLDIMPWLGVAPGLEFKLDPTSDWDAAAMRRIAATGRVRTLDFKAFYEGTPVDNAPDPVQYAAAAAAFPEAILEDPALDGPARDALAGREARFSFDAPVHGWDEVERLREATDGRLRFLNIKPSRFGSLGALFDCVERAQAAGITLYGGGQFELGVGREQIQALASLFYADAPNDVAPRDYHGSPRAGLPASPLRPLGQAPGFGFAWRRRAWPQPSPARPAASR